MTKQVRIEANEKKSEDIYAREFKVYWDKGGCKLTPKVMEAFEALQAASLATIEDRTIHALDNVALAAKQWRAASEKLRDHIATSPVAEKRRGGKRTPRLVARKPGEECVMQVMIDNKWNVELREVELLPIPGAFARRGFWRDERPPLSPPDLERAVVKERIHSYLLVIRYPFRKPRITFCGELPEVDGTGKRKRNTGFKLTYRRLLTSVISGLQEMYEDMKLERSGSLLNRVGESPKYGFTGHGPEDLTITGFDIRFKQVGKKRMAVVKVNIDS